MSDYSNEVRQAISRTRAAIEREGWNIESRTTGDKAHLVMTRGDERKGFGLMDEFEAWNAASYSILGKGID